MAWYSRRSLTDTGQDSFIFDRSALLTLARECHPWKQRTFRPRPELPWRSGCTTNEGTGHHRDFPRGAREGGTPQGAATLCFSTTTRPTGPGAPVPAGQRQRKVASVIGASSTGPSASGEAWVVTAASGRGRRAA
ncbi:hypothetical protein GCM10009759_69060 [Kitasatospora saccharophila]|uniref:Uncharacterized protein n=1 Tax=Kitasatospora saccharophila TaxID=407973 RepID=A0ABN2Y1L4_9ACTN